ncbi:hypothetical protein [Flavobacterium sp.]|uniref:hypothetical protein n=1 Tax=Flavobacterium sp. TaxID=239 RepID=UPI00286DDB33|nr:hypothetical protein [Flavobacterium sp.]
MSQKNQINVVIPETELAAINPLVVQLKEALAPYIVALTTEEIKSIAKMGDKTVAFVDKVRDYTVSNPEFVLQQSINLVDFNVDVDAVKTLSPILKSVSQISTDLQDSIMLCGNEALIPALMYYGSVQLNAKNGVASAKTIYEDLKQRFPGTKRKKIS